MKILAIIFLFGFAAAVSHEDLERARDEALLAFMEGMENAPSLRETMNIPYAEFDEVEEEIKTELGKMLKEHLNDLLGKVKDAIDHGKTVKEDLIEKIKKVKDHLGKLHEEIGDKAKELWERIKEKTKGKMQELLEKLREKLGWKTREERQAFSELNLREKLTDLWEMMKDLKHKGTEDVKNLVEKLKEKIKETFDEKSVMGKALLKRVKEASIDKIMDLKKFIGDLLGLNKELRATKDTYDKIKDYIKEVRDGFEHHFSSFLEWLKNVYKSGADAAKGRIENVKKVALKFLDHAKDVGQKTAHEALEFFRPYKKDLGTLWEELEKRVKEAYGHH